MELNDPYMKFNAMTPETEDYLNKINSPIYTNFCANTPSNDSDGQGTYLNMSKRQEQEMEMKPMIKQGKLFIHFSVLLTISHEGRTVCVATSCVN